MYLCVYVIASKSLFDEQQIRHGSRVYINENENRCRTNDYVQYREKIKRISKNSPFLHYVKNCHGAVFIICFIHMFSLLLGIWWYQRKVYIIFSNNVFLFGHRDQPEAVWQRSAKVIDVKNMLMNALLIRTFKPMPKGAELKANFVKLVCASMCEHCYGMKEAICNRKLEMNKVSLLNDKYWRQYFVYRKNSLRNYDLI